MPFWWRRRKRNWYPRRYFPGYKRRRRRPRYRTRQRRYRYATRRRRRRRRRQRKVRRKKQKIILKQWQPDSITKCKIKGYGILVAGAEGNQYRCYTDQKFEYTQPKAPGGGGFGTEQFSLEYLYKEWLAHKNIWTKSNDYKELVRYTGCKFTFYRHKDIDFIIQYERNPPFILQKDTYLLLHPLNMLLARHKKLLPSASTHPKGRSKLTIKMKPPKLMQTKWFFQKEFCLHSLLRISATSASFNNSLYGPNTQSPNVTLYALNTRLYQNQFWGNQSLGPYKPYNTYPADGYIFEYPTKTGTEKTNPYKAPSSWGESVNRTKGFFQPKILTAIKVYSTQQVEKIHERPITIARYNPEDDTGVGNKIWLTSIMSDGRWRPPSDNDLILSEEPLYIGFWGFWDFINRAKTTKEYMTTHMFVVKSQAIKLITGTDQDVFPLVDLTFIQGNLPYNETLTLQKENLWFPTAYEQVQTINSIVESGLLTPKLNNLPNSTWQLPYTYTFYFKWGGSQIQDQTVHNPKDQGDYPIPTAQLQTIQIADPLKQTYEQMLRAWDYRRGFITTTALKRMSKDQETDENISIDTTEPKKKKRKITSQLQIKTQEQEEIESCLQELCKKSTYQETEDIKQLIHQQQQQQEHLKQHLFNLILEMKQRQKYLQLHTGLL
nr:MAG: ORF1 [Torque teno midi virus]